MLRAGSDVALLSTGLTTERALQAATRLAESGIEAAVLHLSTLKPFDCQAVLSLVENIRNVVTVENHLITGGLGSAVAEVVTEVGLQVRLKRIGIPDCFCASGSIPYLVKRYHLDSESIAAAARDMLTTEKRLSVS